MGKEGGDVGGPGLNLQGASQLEPGNWELGCGSLGSHSGHSSHTPVGLPFGVARSFLGAADCR